MGIEVGNYQITVFIEGKIKAGRLPLYGAKNKVNFVFLAIVLIFMTVI